MSSLLPFGRVRSPRSTPSSRRRPLPLNLEMLEDRVTPAVFNVNSLADVLTPGPGVVTLRSAIQQANQTLGGNTINLTVAGNYQITLPGTPGETDNAAGEFAILPTGGNLTIQNTSGGPVTVNGGGHNRVFDINPAGGTAAPKFTVTLQGITIENGFAFDANNPDGPNGSGGGIRDQGNASLTLNDVVFTNNQASADGGGVSMENVVSTPWTLNIVNSTVSFNRAGDAGGGVETDGSGHVNITNSVIDNNTATNQGAGVWLDAIQPGTITNPVITNGGSGYTTAPPVTFDGGGATDPATGFAVVQNGQVVGIVLTNAGAGYTSAPTIKIGLPGSGGTFATATTTVNQVLQSATLNITGTTIDGNLALAADNFGGGVGNAGNGVVTITSSTLAGNFSGGNGGGFADQNGVGTLVVLNSTFVNNSAIADGGAIFEGSTNTTTIQNSTITGNSSQANAGGVEVLNGNLVLNNTIVAQNVAGPMNFVGGVTAVNLITNGGIVPYSNATTVVFTNATGDTTGNGAAATVTVSGGFITAVTITNPGTGYQLPPLVSFVDPGMGAGATATSTIAGAAPDIFATVSTGSGDFIGIGDLNLTGITNGTNGNQIGTAASPLNPDLGPLENNGGLTFTEAPLPGSLVINAGVNTAVPASDPITGATITDQRGFVRFVGSAVDIGAVEFQPGATTITLTSDHANVIQGQPVVLTAHVAPATAAPNNPVTGTVVFTDGGLILGSATLDAHGNASITVTNLPVGNSAVVTTYTPDAAALPLGFTGSSSTLPETVNAANVTPVLTLTTSVVTVTTTTPGALTFTETVTITLKVTAPTGVTAMPTGTVTFFDGTLALNATPIALDATGMATLQLTGLPMGAALVGGQSLTAVYTPDATGTANGFVTASSGTTILNVGTPAELVLNQLFKDLLGRPVNSFDLQYWVPQLGDQSNPASATAQQAVRQVTLGILNSDAFRMQEITWLFANYLGRTPNSNDLSFWLPNFRNGMTIEQAAAIFVTSPEFIADHGGTSDNTVNGVPSSQLVTALFQDALGRSPLASELQSVQGHSLQQVVSTIFNSPEYHGHLVDVFYQDFLRRRALGGEDQFWVNFYPGGPTANQVPAGVQPDVFILSGFIGSQEYISDAISSPMGEPPIPANPLQASIM